MIAADDLAPLVERWLPAQRFFAGKGRPGTVSVRALATLTDGPPPVTVWVAHVRYSDDAPGARAVEDYQLPLVERAEPVDWLQHVLLGTVEGPDGPRWVYDALHDKDVTQAWPAAMADGATVGPLHFERFVEPDLLPLAEESIVLTGEQSNTSLVFGDRAILKVFRRLEHGLNPDIEVHRALTALGATHVAELYGSLTAESADGPTSLAMLQDFMSTATDGWELAKTSVRDLMAEADLHAAEAGGDFAGEAERLGAATAQTHRELAQAFGEQRLDASEVAARAADMHARLDAALPVVPQLAEVEAGLRSAFDDFAAQGEGLRVHRVHGDLHLGQVLRTARRWVILDFEGEPVKSLAERRQFDSPLRDVAGMLRSFDYAARHQLADVSFTSQLEYRADEWALRNRAAYEVGYAGDEPETDLARRAVLLRAFEADKAVYEAVYEARNRPGWLAIPLASLARLAHAPQPWATPTIVDGGPA